MCRQVPEYARLLGTFIEGSPNCVLITEFRGAAESELLQKIQDLRHKLKKEQLPTTIVTVTEPDRQNYVWTVRKVGLGRSWEAGPDESVSARTKNRENGHCTISQPECTPNIKPWLGKT